MSTRGSIKQSDSGWYFVVDVPSPSGARKQVRRRGFKTKKEAQAALTDILGDVQHGTFVLPDRITVQAYLEYWLTSLPRQGRRVSTVDSYQRLLAHHVYPTLGRVELQKLRALDLDGLYARLAEPTPTGRLRSKRTIRLTHSVIGRALSDAERAGLVQRNVARLASPPSSSSAHPPEMTVWTPHELRTFLSAAADHPHAVLVRVAAMTGLRRGELCGLRWTALDLDGGRLTVTRALLAVHGRLVESEPKTARSRRVIDLDPATVAMLRDHRRRQVEDRLAFGAGYDDDGYVFARPDGRPWNPEQVSRTFDRLVRATSLPRIRLHDLRHTHTTHLLAAGTNVRVVSERLGHASVSFTLDVYGHVLPGQQATAALAVAELVDRSVTIP